MADLRETMVDIRIGALSNCFFSITRGIDVVQDITWFSARDRVNRFTISTIDPTLPNCEANAGLRLFAAIQEVIESAGSSPNSQVD